MKITDEGLTPTVIEVTEVAHHRNGVGGAPFYAVAFKHGGEELVGVVFYEGSSEAAKSDEIRCAVLNRTLLKNGVVTFGINSYRGDHFEPALLKAINKYEKGRDKKFAMRA